MIKQLIVLVVILFATASGLVLADRSGVFCVSDVQVQLPTLDQKFFADKQNALTVQLQKLRGEKLWRLSIQNVSAGIIGHDWIDQVQITREFPDRLKVRITPKAIPLVYQDARGQLIPVASDGSFLKPARLAELPDVLILRGKILGEQAELRLQAIKMIDEMPHEGKLTPGSISEISYKNPEGFQLVLYHHHAKIQMGQSDFRRKALRVSHVLSYLESHGIESRVIDASYAHKVWVKKAPPQTPPVGQD